MEFIQWLIENDVYQKLFPWATEENPVDIKKISRFKSIDNYIKNQQKGSRQTDVAAEKLILSYPNSNYEQIVQIVPNYIVIPPKQMGSQIRPQWYISFVHLKTINNVNPNDSYYDRPRHRILAYFTGKKQGFTKDQVFDYFHQPIGGVSYIGNDIDVVWVASQWRGTQDNISIYKELRNFAKKRGAVDLKPNDDLTSKYFRAAQAKYDWKRAGR